MRTLAVVFTGLVTLAACGDDTTQSSDTAAPDTTTAPDITPDAETSAPTVAAVDDRASTDEDQPLTLSAATLLANDTDAVTVTAVTIPDHGSVTLADGTLTFTPTANFSGEAAFSYTASDANGASASARVVVTVAPIADAPRLVDATLDVVPTPPFTFAELVDDDGSEALSATLSGLPASFTLSAGTLTIKGAAFAPQVLVPVGVSSVDVTVARFDGDAFDDIATVDVTGDTVHLLLGNGDGTFRVGASVPVGSRPAKIISGRFDADDDVDFAVPNAEGDSLSVCLNNGDATFACTTVAANTAPSAIGLGDFHNDGKADLVTVGYTEPGTVSVFKGDGLGGFTRASTLQLPTPGGAVRVARLDDDANDDLVVSLGRCFEDCLRVYLGNGDGTFDGPTIFEVGDIPERADVHDVDLDGTPDIVVPSVNGQQISVLLGNGDGTFEQLPAIVPPRTPTGLVVGHFDVDLFPDLAVSAPNIGQLMVFAGRGDGTFSPPVIYPIGNNPLAIALGHFDADTLDDLALSELGAGVGGAHIVLQTLPTLDATFTAAELVGLTLTPPVGFAGTLTIAATATATESATGAAATTSGSITITVPARP